MPVAGEGDVDGYKSLLSQIAPAVSAVDVETETRIRVLVGELEAVPEVTREVLCDLIRQHPDSPPDLALLVGLGRERFKRQLHHHTGSEAWKTRAQTEPETIIDMLDDEFGIVDRAEQLRGETYTLADVLIARAGSRSTAGGAVSAGRALEDRVEEVIQGLALPYAARTQFGGRGDESAPCDFAIPTGGTVAQIAIPVKGFDSTGSKLTAAYDEIKNVANVRLPGQYIFAVVDGVGWLGRAGDLGRLVDMVRRREIDGMFTLKEFAVFKAALRDAAIRSRLLEP